MLAFATALLLVAGGCGSCRDEPSPPPKTQVEPEPAEPPAEPKAYAKVREAYGAPVPPEVVYVKEMVDFIEVGTMLRLEELRGFFEERVVDYEFIQRNRNSLRLVGLRSGMPTIWIDQGTLNMPVKVRYVQQRPRAQAAPGTVGAKPEPMPRQGEPVENRLPNGELVAPGARWGEPYVPPQGSPLAQPRYRANFGKPFGTWILN